MTESEQNRLAAEIERYKKQMMDYYQAGKTRSDTSAPAEFVPAVTTPETTPVTPPPEEPAPDPDAVIIAPRPAVLVPNNPPWSPSIASAYADQYPKTGYIKTSVLTARGALPLNGADVTILKTIDGMTRVFAHGKTDESGNFPSVALPAPSKDLSEVPVDELIRPYATYDVVVTSPDYIPVKSYGVPVFEGIVSIQTFNLIPRSAATQPDQIEEIFETGPAAL